MTSGGEVDPGPRHRDEPSARAFAGVCHGAWVKRCSHGQRGRVANDGDDQARAGLTESQQHGQQLAASSSALAVGPGSSRASIGVAGRARCCVGPDRRRQFGDQQGRLLAKSRAADPIPKPLRVAVEARGPARTGWRLPAHDAMRGSHLGASPRRHAGGTWLAQASAMAPTPLPASVTCDDSWSFEVLSTICRKYEEFAE
jgi:hypothetical protein